MQRKGKTSFTKAKSKLLCCLLSGALLFGNLMVFQTVPASAAEVTEHDNGNQESLQPKIVVSNYKELAQAIEESEDGNVIGIDNIIELNLDVSILGNSEKRLTICRMSENSYISASLSADVKVENIIFDGRGVDFDRCYVPMFQVEGKVNFKNVTFQNCYNNWSGGAVIANGGEMNITGCHFINNRASEGGHIIVQSAKISVQNSIFENGIAENGGGAVKVGLIYGYDNGIEFNNCKLVGNQAKFGGAIANHGNVKITSSVIYGNQAKSAADIINYLDSSFQVDSIEEVMELYKESGITPKEWIYDYDNKSYISGDIDKSNPNAALKLVYEEIPQKDNSDGVGDSNTEDSSGGNDDKSQVENEDKKDESDSENGGSGKDELKGDTIEIEQPKDDNNGDDSAADNKDNAENKKDENGTDGDNVPENDNIGDANSEQIKPEGSTAADIDSNKDGSSSDSDKKDIEDSNNNRPDSSTDSNNQTSNPSIEKANIGNNSSVSDSKPEGNTPDNTISNGNQSGTSDGNMENNNQNQTNTPISGAANNTTNGNVSGNTNSGSGSSTGNSNINTGASQNGGNESSKPEGSEDNNSDSSYNRGTAAIAGDSQNTASDSDNGSSGKTTVTKKKAIKKLSLTAKKGKKRITGKTIKKATVKVRIGKRIYKVKSNAKGKFTVKLKGKAKLKKGQKIKITVSKKGYEVKIKIFEIK